MAGTASRFGTRTVMGALRAWRRRTSRVITTMTFIGISLSSVLIVPAARAQTPAAQPQPAWHATALSIQGNPKPCFDTATPGLFYTSERQGDAASSPQVTYANNVLSGQRAVIAMSGFDLCNARTGSLFAHIAKSATALRFSAREPTGRTIDHFPDYIAPDGSVLYSAGNGFPSQYTHREGEIVPESASRLFYVSVDDGLTWQERGAQFGGSLAAIAPVDGAPQSIYALVRPDPEDHGKAMGGIPYSLQFSADAGATWEQRYAGMLPYVSFYGYSGEVYLHRIPGIATPATTIGLDMSAAHGGAHGSTDFQFSADGGRTFTRVGGAQDEAATQFYATSAGIIRTWYSSEDIADLSIDGGITFTPLALPVNVSTAYAGRDLQLTVAPTAPNLVLCYRVSFQPTISPPSDLYLSRDGGKTWSRLTAQPQDAPIFFMPTTPPALLAFAQMGVLTLDLMGASIATGASPTMGATPATIPSAMTATAVPTAAATTAPVAPVNFMKALAALTARGSTAASNLGPTLSDPSTDTGIVTQSFEHGAMFYVSGQNTFYAILITQGYPMVVIPRTFGDAGLTMTLGPGPRPGTFVPRLGFGKIWQDNPALQQQLGYATDDERHFTDSVQRYQNGIVVADTAKSSVYVLNTALSIWDGASL